MPLANANAALKKEAKCRSQAINFPYGKTRVAIIFVANPGKKKKINKKSLKGCGGGSEQWWCAHNKAKDTAKRTWNLEPGTWSPRDGATNCFQSNTNSVIDHSATFGFGSDD